jgi:hypothetical protein
MSFAENVRNWGCGIGQKVTDLTADIKLNVIVAGTCTSLFAENWI